ncbi:MAG: HD-GYP domain-containing protein [Candidatus Omnitrophota bacterium]
MLGKIQLSSFENASIIRKMTILYFLMSIIPVGVLYYLYLMIKTHGEITLDEPQFALVLAFVVLGVGVGYVALRAMLFSVVEVTIKSAKTLKDILGPVKTGPLAYTDTNEIKVLARSFNEVTTQLEENIRNLELAKKTLSTVLSRIGEGISSMENIDGFLDLIIETMTEALSGRAGFLFLTEETTGDFILKSFFGCDGKKIPTERVYHDDCFIQDICAQKQPVIISKIPASSVLAPILESPVLAAPMILHEDELGIILLSGRVCEEKFADEEKELLYNLALQTAVAIENSKLNEDRERTYFETISALAMAVEAKDPYSRGHLDRVANLAVRIAEEMNLSKDDGLALRDAAKLHDLGKIGIVDDILTKNGPLNKEESLLMKKHPVIGEGIIKPIHSLSNLCDIVRHHHEKLDGSGYPDGLKGDEISLLVRILTVADIFDALTSDRPYRKALVSVKAINEMRLMGEKIDQKIVNVLEKVI